MVLFNHYLFDIMKTHTYSYSRDFTNYCLFVLCHTIMSIIFSTQLESYRSLLYMWMHITASFKVYLYQKKYF